MSAGQTINASRNFITSEFHPWICMSAFNPILIFITPAPCIALLALSPLPAAPDFPFPAVPAVGLGTNIDTGEGFRVGVTLGSTDVRSDNVAFPEADVREGKMDWMDSGFGVMRKSAV